MKKLRRIVKDVDPETGDVSYFPAGTSSLFDIERNNRPRKRTKAQRAERRRRYQAHYAGCPPRPLFHTATERLPVESSERYQQRLEVLERDGYRCRQCNTTKGLLTVDHRIPLSKGGGNHLENLWCLCASCNTNKGSQLPHELEAA